MLKNFSIDKNMAKLILFQRVELLNSFQKKIRKIFGRYLFKNFMINFFLNIKKIESIYYNRMLEEFNEIKGEIEISNKSILSIGGGLGGLDLILSSYFKQANFSIIERNYISKKIIYGWDNNNSEAYNILDLTFKFLTNNGMSQNNFKIYDFDKKNLPIKKFDMIISLYSLDYHYDFKVYEDYFREISTKNTKFIFDTIRPDYFYKKFENVKIIENHHQTVHRSKRLICIGFK